MKELNFEEWVNSKIGSLKVVSAFPINRRAETIKIGVFYEDVEGLHHYIELSRAEFREEGGQGE